MRICHNVVTLSRQIHRTNIEWHFVHAGGRGWAGMGLTYARSA